MSRPKLLLFAACEKVLIDRDSNNTSLISVLETLNLQGRKPDTEIPEDAVVPFTWNILALWQNNPENTKQWEQRVLVDLPKGLDVTLKILFEEGKPNFRSVISVQGFPLGQLLDRELCLVELFLREQGTETWGEPIGKYPIVIRHLKESQQT